MSRLDDIIGQPAPPPEGEAVDIDMMCETCFWPCDECFYNKERKLVTGICQYNHKTVLQIDLSWLSG